jgi:F-type H+-transporting ATPase subunit b
MTFANQAGLVLVFALAATPAFAQPAPREAAGDPAAASGPGTEYHGEAQTAAPAAPGGAGEPGPREMEDDAEDPSRHFNFFGLSPGHVFDYRGKDEYGGPLGDGKMVDPQTQRVIPEEEPASPPFIFMLLNFALLLGLLAWKGRPVAQKAAAERHDLIKTALDEAAKLRQQAADKLAEYEARLKDADAEIKQLVEGMRVDAENEKQRILAAAEAQAQLMKRDAELRIAAEIELARARLVREVTAAAAAATEALLREKLTATDQQALVASFITGVQPTGSVGRTTPTGQGEVR